MQRSHSNRLCENHTTLKASFNPINHLYCNLFLCGWLRWSLAHIKVARVAHRQHLATPCSDTGVWLFGG